MNIEKNCGYLVKLAYQITNKVASYFLRTLIHWLPLELCKRTSEATVVDLEALWYNQWTYIHNINQHTYCRLQNKYHYPECQYLNLLRSSSYLYHNF